MHRFENLTDQTRVILFCDVARPIRSPVVRALNRWVIRHLVGMTATKNVEGEKVGLANRLFGVVYPLRVPLRRFKNANRRLYYLIKYLAIAGALYLALFGLAA